MSFLFSSYSEQFHGRDHQGRAVSSAIPSEIRFLSATCAHFSAYLDAYNELKQGYPNTPAGGVIGVGLKPARLMEFTERKLLRMLPRAIRSAARLLSRVDPVVPNRNELDHQLTVLLQEIGLLIRSDVDQHRGRDIECSLARLLDLVQLLPQSSQGDPAQGNIDPPIPMGTTPKLLLSVVEVKEQYQVSSSKVTRWCKAGKLVGAAKDKNGDWRIPESTVASTGWKKRIKSLLPEKHTARLKEPADWTCHACDADEIIKGDRRPAGPCKKCNRIAWVRVTVKAHV